MKRIAESRSEQYDLARRRVENDRRLPKKYHDWKSLEDLCVWQWHTEILTMRRMPASSRCVRLYSKLASSVNQVDFVATVLLYVQMFRGTQMFFLLRLTVRG